MSKYSPLWDYIKNRGESPVTLTFGEIAGIAGVPIDHSFLRYKKELLEYGFAEAKALGFKAVLVEGDPRNYASRGFQASWRFGITAGPHVELPSPDCLMVKELEPGGLEKMSGLVDFSFYEALR